MAFVLTPSDRLKDSNLNLLDLDEYKVCWFTRLPLTHVQGRIECVADLHVFTPPLFVVQRHFCETTGSVPVPDL